MDRREALVAMASAIAVASVAPVKPPCQVCGTVGFVTIRTGEYSTMNVVCPMECPDASRSERGGSHHFDKKPPTV